MSKYLTIGPHLTPAELCERYRAATDAGLRGRYQRLCLLASGRRAKDVAGIVGYTAEWVRDLARRYNQLRPGGLADGRQRPDAGRPPLLTAEDQAELAAWIDAGGPAEGLVNSTTVANWMSARLRRPVRYQVGHRYLQRLGYSPQRPRPQHASAGPEAREAFKKGALRQP